jgi:low temperature requirement protein LtrA
MTAEWDVEGGHMAERCGLFIIIALGESILATGATYADLIWSGETIAGFVAAFVGSVAMWWIYFNIGPGPAPFSWCFSGFRPCPGTGA